MVRVPPAGHTTDPHQPIPGLAAVSATFLLP
jgi:hypothetical protein